MIPLTDEERNAVYDSIEHWQRDILEPFLHGAIGVTGPCGPMFIYSTSDGDFDYNYIKDRDDYCPLCALMYSKNTGCGKCPYYRMYGESCDGGIVLHHNYSVASWKRFHSHPTRLNAEAMIAELRAIVDWQPDPRKKA